SEVELCTKFSSRAFCMSEKLKKLLVSSAFKPFCDVRKNRYYSTPHLVAESKVLRKRTHVGQQFVNSIRQNASLFPSFYFLKPSNLPHDLDFGPWTLDLGL